MKVFYQTRKSLKEYKNIFTSNLLTSAIESLISQLPIHFNLGKTSENRKQSYPDLDLGESGDLKLDQVSSLILHDKISFFSLSTILKVEKAQMKYNEVFFNNPQNNEEKKEKADHQAILGQKKERALNKF